MVALPCTSTTNKKLVYLCTHFLCLSKANLQSSCLVICAIWTWHQFTESSTAWKPSLQIILHGCCIVEFTWYWLDSCCQSVTHLPIPLYHSVLFTWRAAMLVYENRRQCSHKNWVQLTHDWLLWYTSMTAILFVGAPIWRLACHVLWKVTPYLTISS